LQAPQASNADFLDNLATVRFTGLHKNPQRLSALGFMSDPKNKMMVSPDGS